MGNEALLFLIFTGILFAGGALVFSKLVAPFAPNTAKQDPYECGIPTIGPTWFQFRVGYYLFALAFLIFEIEVVYLFPWAVVLKELGMIAFIEVLIFLVILFLGLLYAWKKGALKWV